MGREPGAKNRQSDEAVADSGGFMSSVRCGAEHRILAGKPVATARRASASSSPAAPPFAMISTSLAGLLFTASSLAVPAGDWPQYHGPARDRTSPEEIASFAWTADGPTPVWKVETPTGFSSFAVADGLACTLVGRELDGAAREVCVALDAGTGKERWFADLGPARYDGGGDRGTRTNQGGDGPRSTPSLDAGRVYVLSSRLLLACFDAATGKEVWRSDLIEEHDGELLRWQSAASPLVDGDLVFVAAGGPGYSLLAFDKTTGEPQWGTGDERLTHATPVAATIHDVRQVIFFMQSGLVAVEAETGDELWRAEYPYQTSTAASPVVLGDVVYCSAGYGVGAGAFRIARTDAGFTAELLWQKRNKLMNHWSTPVAKDGYIYGMFGFKNYGAAPMKCIDAMTGEEKWSADGYGPGNCILVGDVLVALGDAGDVVVIAARPD